MRRAQELDRVVTILVTHACVGVGSPSSMISRMNGSDNRVTPDVTNGADLITAETAVPAAAAAFGTVVADAMKAIQRDVVKMSLLGAAAIAYRWLHAAAQRSQSANVLVNGPLAIALIVRSASKNTVQELKRFFGLSLPTPVESRHFRALRAALLLVPAAITGSVLRAISLAREAAAFEAERLARMHFLLKGWRALCRSSAAWHPQLERGAGAVASVVGTGSAIKYLLAPRGLRR